MNELSGARAEAGADARNEAEAEEEAGAAVGKGAPAWAGFGVLRNGSLICLLPSAVVCLSASQPPMHYL